MMKFTNKGGKNALINLFFNTKSIALIGVMAATVECGKLALAYIPNVEVVSLLLALYGYVFGWMGVVCAFVFVLAEVLVWGVGSWIISYLIYWPILAFVFMVLSKIGVRNRWILTLVIGVLTLLFGALTSLVDGIVLFGFNESFIKSIALYYLRGIPFYLTQLACNIALFLTVFNYLADKLTLIRRKMLI